MFTACGITHRRRCSIVGALYHKLKTQSSTPEDGRNYRPKHVELIVVVNKTITVGEELFYLVEHTSNHAFVDLQFECITVFNARTWNTKFLIHLNQTENSICIL